GAEDHGTLVPTRRIVEKLAPRGPDGERGPADLIARRLGIETVALSRQTHEFLERVVWRAERWPLGGPASGLRFPAQGGLANGTLRSLVSGCMGSVLPAADRARVRRHVHIGVAPPADMDFHMGLLRRRHGLAEHMPTEYVTMACPALPAVLMNLARVEVAEE